MNFLKSKAYKIMSFAEIVVLCVIIALNLISSFVALSKGLSVAFFTIILIGALYIIGISITSIVLIAKEKRKQNEEEKNEGK